MFELDRRLAGRRLRRGSAELRPDPLRSWVAYGSVWHPNTLVRWQD